MSIEGRQVDDNQDISELDRRSSMTLLSDPADIFCHCCRAALYEKDIELKVEYVSEDEDAERISTHNPFLELPVLIDREISLYDMSVIMEYLDERYPYPPLMPVDPVVRAKARLLIYRMTRDWLTPLHNLGTGMLQKLPDSLKKSLLAGFVSMAQVVQDQDYFLGPEYSLVDAYMGPLLWRLPNMDIELPASANPILKYSRNVFKRESFRQSLSEVERAMR